jgi:hypothetical protein
VDWGEQWAQRNYDQRQRYLGKLDLLARLALELEGEQATAIREARRYGAQLREIALVSGLGQKKIRALLDK